MSACIHIYNADYSTARSASSGTVYTPEIIVAQWKNVALSRYYIYRGFLIFDTSSVSAVKSATLKIYPTFKGTDRTFDLIIQNGQPTYPHNPVEVGDYDMVNYSGDGGSLASTDIALGKYNEIEITELDWINAGGDTKLCLRVSRDIDNDPPSSISSEYITITNSSPNTPQLLVTGANTSWLFLNMTMSL